VLRQSNVARLLRNAFYLHFVYCFYTVYTPAGRKTAQDGHFVFLVIALYFYNSLQLVQDRDGLAE